MRKTMNVWSLIGVLACVMISFLVYNSKLTANINELDQAYNQGNLRIADLENKQMKLKETLETAGSDAFIENQARTLYGYMMPDEIRFVITNPEALYGDEKIPSR